MGVAELVDAAGSGPAGRKSREGSNPSPHNKKMTEEPLKIIPLGGLEEVGRNMTLFEYKGKILILDMGLMFPDDTMPGVDFIIPNTQYLKGKERDIVGVVLTHGHYDHIGAIPYIIGKIGNPPIFATPLTKGIVEKRQKDFPQASPLRIQEIKREDEIILGPFKIKTVPLNHNIPDNVGVFIETPVGTIFHTGDFKIDFTPVGDEPADLSKIAKIASKGVLLLMSDSTNAEEKGHSLSEKEIMENLEFIFKNAKGRIIATTFASLISRIQELIFLAEKYGRKILVEGYTMRSNFEISWKLGKIKVNPESVITPRELKKIPDDKVLIICTGSQGEGDAVLMRLAHKDHPYLKVKKGDIVIISSSTVPGNERAVQELKDLLSWQGAKIYHSKIMDIHASGHANQEELKTMIRLIAPKFFMPVHGSHYMLECHKEIAINVGIPEKNIIVVGNGDLIELYKDEFKIHHKKVPAHYVMVDGLGIGDVGEVVLRDRQVMAKDGMFVIVVVVDSHTGRVKQSPDIISRGFVYLRESQRLLYETRKRTVRLVERIIRSKHPINWSYVKSRIREELGEFLYEKTKRRPMVLPVIIEV